jgi:hypothetical protein
MHGVAVAKVTPVETVDGDDEEFAPRRLLLLRGGGKNGEREDKSGEKSTHLEAKPPAELYLP